MTLKGDLDSISLADVFQTLSMTQQEGTLFVQDRESRKAIYFSKDGVRLVTTGEKKGGKLGDMLVGMGKITQDQLDEALGIHKEDGIRLGEVLIRLGFVTEKDIEAAVRVQIEEEIYDLFSWEGGSFEFAEGPPPDGTFEADDLPVTQLTFNVNSLIMEAARRIDEWDLIEKVIPSTREIFIVDPRVNELEYTDRERRILRYLDGQHDVREIVDHSHVPKFDVCKFIYRLVEEEKVHHAPFETLLEFGDQAVSEEDLPRAVKFYEQALQGKIKKKSDQIKARLRLAQALEYLDRKKEAADQYKVLADAKIEEKDVEGAINIWQKVIDLNPLDLENKERLINVYLENRAHLDPGRSDVIRSIEFSLFKNGKSLAMAFAYAGQIDRAKEVLNRLIELVPSNVELRKALANIHLDAGEKAEAVEELEHIAQFLLANRNYEEIREVYKNILKIDPSRADIRKKISMIEAGEAVGPTSERRSLLKPLLIGLAVLLVLGAAGGIGYYQFLAHQQWKTVATEARAIWKRSKADNATPQGKKRFREEARAKVEGFRKNYPYTPFQSDDIEKLLSQWEEEERQEEEEIRSFQEGQAKAVSALLLDMENLYNSEKPLDVQEPVEKIDQAWKEARDNPYADKPLKKLAQLKKAFLRLRRVADELWNEARNAIRKAEETGEFRQYYAIAWTKLAELYEKGRRFRDLWEKIELPVRFETSPPGAEVVVNGRPPRKTPFTFMKEPETALDVRVSRLGYRDLQRTVRKENLSRDKPIDFEQLCFQSYDLEIVPLAETAIPNQNVISDPVAAGGSLFVGNDLGDVIVLTRKADALTEEWRYKPSKDVLKYAFRSRFIASDRHVFFPCEDGKVYGIEIADRLPLRPAFFALDPQRGENDHTIRGRGGAALSGPGDALVVGTDKGVTAFDLATRRILWQYLLEDAEDKAWAVPACHEGKVYAGTDAGKILAFRLHEGPEDGKPLWQVSTRGEAIRSGLAVWETRLFAGTENGNLLALDLLEAREGLEAGEGIERQFMGSGTKVTCKPLFAGGFLFVTAGRYLYKYKPTTLEMEWRFDAGGRSGKVSPPSRIGNSIYLGNGDGTLFAVDWRGDAPQRRWTWKTTGEVRVRPATDREGSVYFLTQTEEEIHILLFRE